MTDKDEVVLVQLGDCAEQSGPVGSICTEESFRLRRAFADERGSRWFVLSGHHGIVAPDEWVTSRPALDSSGSPRYWRAWADWVAAQLDRRLKATGGLGGLRVTLLADPEWEAQLTAAFEAWGVELAAPLADLGEDERDSWVSERLEDPPPALPADTGTGTVLAGRPGQEAVGKALLEYRAEALQRDRSRLGFASDPEADARPYLGGRADGVGLDRRFRRFKRIGPKKAAMTVELLMTHFGVSVHAPEGTNVAYDVHVRRVFTGPGW